MKALVIIDMVNDFVHENGSLTVGQAARGIVPYINDLVAEFAAKGDHVIIANDCHNEYEEQFTSGQWPKHCIVGTWGELPYGGLKLPKTVRRVYKKHYNAFFETDLPMKMPPLVEVHFCGVCTDICVFATAMGAHQLGYPTVVHARGCATFTGKHDLFLGHMMTCFGTKVIA